MLLLSGIIFGAFGIMALFLSLRSKAASWPWPARIASVVLGSSFLTSATFRIAEAFDHPLFSSETRSIVLLVLLLLSAISCAFWGVTEKKQ